MLEAHLKSKLGDLTPKEAPFALAFSGGGDSTALVHALRHHPRARKVYIVDHNLRAGSAEEALQAQRFAKNLGYDVEILKWRNLSPKTAIQEKARQARYGLMGDACRKDGIKFLVTAHSEGDQAETLLMRYERRTDWRGAAGMSELSYGSVWPQLADISILRPLLEVTRESLREYNREYGLSWADDPSNQNRDFARIRARDYLKTHRDVRHDLLRVSADMRAGLSHEKMRLRTQFSEIGTVDKNGIITLSEVPLPELIFHCLRCAGGQGHVIDRHKIKTLMSHMRSPSFKSATLGGALVAKHGNGYVICRDPVAVKGRQDSHHQRREMRGNLILPLSDSPQIWDGRFLVTAQGQGCFVGSVEGNSEILTKAQKDSLKTVPAVARPTLPLFKDKDSVQLVGSGETSEGEIKSLVKARLEAALGGAIG